MGDVRSYSIEKISIQGDLFEVSLLSNESGGDDLTFQVEQSVLFDKIKDAFTKKEVISDCDNCMVRDMPPLPDQMAWFCFKFPIRQENCTGYEPR